MAIDVLTLNLTIEIFLNSKLLGLDFTRNSIILKNNVKIHFILANIKTH